MTSYFMRGAKLALDRTREGRSDELAPKTPMDKEDADGKEFNKVRREFTRTNGKIDGNGKKDEKDEKYKRIYNSYRDDDGSGSESATDQRGY